MKAASNNRFVISLRSILTALVLGLGISAGPVQAFFPMMLLMLPMMTDGQHVMAGRHGSGAEQGAPESDARRADGAQGAPESHAQHWLERPSNALAGEVPRAVSPESRQIIAATGPTPTTSAAAE